MARNSLPHIDYVRECLDYNPNTGEFHWRERPLEHFRNNQAHSCWNTKYAERPAGGYNTFGHVYIRLVHLFAAHRLAWLLFHGEPIPDVIDHVDHNPANNRIRNLRAATHSDNMANSVLSANNTTGHKGIKIIKNRFVVQIMHLGVRRRLGTFSTIEEAAEARRIAAERLYGEFNRQK